MPTLRKAFAATRNALDRLAPRARSALPVALDDNKQIAEEQR